MAPACAAPQRTKMPNLSLVNRGSYAMVPWRREASSALSSQAEDRREGAEQHRHLEHDDDVGRNRGDRLAADHERPVVGHVQGEPRPDRAAGDAADQGAHPDRARRLIERVFQLVARHRRIHREASPWPPGLERAHRVDGRVQVPEHRRARPVWRAVGKSRATARRSIMRPSPRSRLGGGRTSLISGIATIGKFLANSRNHIPNQPNEPARMPQSAQVGL